MNAIFNCLNCGIVFTSHDWCYNPADQWYAVCPNPDCFAVDMYWDEMLEVDIMSLFYSIIGQNFDEARRENLRGISESMMEPYPWQQ